MSKYLIYVYMYICIKNQDALPKYFNTMEACAVVKFMMGTPFAARVRTLLNIKVILCSFFSRLHLLLCQS